MSNSDQYDAQGNKEGGYIFDSLKNNFDQIFTKDPDFLALKRQREENKKQKKIRKKAFIQLRKNKINAGQT